MKEDTIVLMLFFFYFYENLNKNTVNTLVFSLIVVIVFIILFLLLDKRDKRKLTQKKDLTPEYKHNCDTVDPDPYPEIKCEPELAPEPKKIKDILDDVDVEFYIGSIAFEEAKKELPYIPVRYSLDDSLMYSNYGLDLNDRDPLFEESARLIVVHQQGSTSLVQRKFSIGYNRAGRIMDQLEAASIVGPAQGSKPREVLIATECQLEQKLTSSM